MLTSDNNNVKRVEVLLKQSQSQPQQVVAEKGKEKQEEEKQEHIEYKLARLSSKTPRRSEAPMKPLSCLQESINRLPDDEGSSKKTVRLEHEADSLKRDSICMSGGAAQQSLCVDADEEYADFMGSYAQYDNWDTREHSAGSLIDDSLISEDEQAEEEVQVAVAAAEAKVDEEKRKVQGNEAKEAEEEEDDDVVAEKEEAFDGCGEATHRQSTRTCALKTDQHSRDVLHTARLSRGSISSRRCRRQVDVDIQRTASIRPADERPKSPALSDMEVTTGLQDCRVCKKSQTTAAVDAKECDRQHLPVVVGAGNRGLALRSRTPSVNRLNRPHRFAPRSLLHIQSCDACGRWVAFGKPAFKCTECRLVVHSACSELLVQTCVPTHSAATPGSSPIRHIKKSELGHKAATETAETTEAEGAGEGAAVAVATTAGAGAAAFASPRRSLRMRTPTSNKLPRFSLFQSSPSIPQLPRGEDINLDYWCPLDQQPRVPALVIHCANEVSVRGLHTVGLYRAAGSSKQVIDLYDKFLRAKSTPALARIDDIHVVCGCLKLFLRNLSEPLVTYKLRPFFHTASGQLATNPDHAVASVLKTLSKLPAPNLDTLAFVLLHLMEVARSPACRMNQESLSKAFGPALIGYSCPEPKVMQTILELPSQHAIMKLLFRVPEQTYLQILWPESAKERVN